MLRVPDWLAELVVSVRTMPSGANEDRFKIIFGATASAFRLFFGGVVAGRMPIHFGYMFISD